LTTDFSKIILGTAQFGLNYGINNSSGKISKNKIFKILDYAIDSGINTLDTAPSYGNSEEIIGEYLEFNPGKSIRVITKISLSNDSLEIQLMNSLNKLKIQKVNTLLFHSINLYEKFHDELPFFIDNFKGKYFDEIGVSIYWNDQVDRIINDEKIDRIQLPFNLLDNSSLRKSIILKLKSNNKKVDARSVFLQGLFFKPIENLSNDFEFLKKELLILNDLTKKYKIPIESLALNYVLSKKFIDRTIIGIDSLKQLKSNIKNINSGVIKELFTKIEFIRIQNPKALNPSLWPKY
jgi:aryl-alcohol dehydrogenase-like predicted oxidoreductase